MTSPINIVGFPIPDASDVACQTVRFTPRVVS